MKKILIALSIIPIIGKTQTIEFIEPRNVQQFERVDYHPVKTADQFYMVMDKYNMKSQISRDIQIDVYNTSFKTQTSAKVESGSLAIDDANIFEGIENIGGQLYLFKYHFVKKETKLALNYYPISNKAERGSGTELLKFTAEKAMNAGNFTVKASPDGNYFAVLAELPAEKEMNEKCIVWVYDKSFKEIWKKEYEFTYESSKGPRNELFVNNNGVVFIEKRIPVKKAIDTHSIFTFVNNGGDVKETKITMATDAILSTYKTNFDTDGNLIMSGFYYIDKKVGVNVETPNGPFYIKVNAKDGSIPVQVAGNSTKLQNLITVSAILNEDQSIILTGEQVYEKSEPKYPGTTSMESNYIYNHMSILVVKLNADGSMAWEYLIERDLTSTNDNGKMNSVFTFTRGDKTILIFKDKFYKHDGEPDKAVIGPPLSTMMADAVITLDKDGKLSTDTYVTDERIGGKKGEYYFIPASGYKIDDNTVWMLATRNMELVSVLMKF
jgi:hypothetical protein